MSHVDEGTLHAYLDGELTAVERERVEAHLKGCPTCQARLEEERAIIERASRLLGMAAPPERAIPPLTQVRQRRLLWWQVRRPLVWAATLVLAVGLGWFARGRTLREPNAETSVANFERPHEYRVPANHYTAPAPDSVNVAMRPEGHLAMRRALPLADSNGKDRDALQVQRESAEVTTGAAASSASNTLGRLDSTPALAGVVALQPAEVTRKLPRANAAGVRIRGAEAQPAPSVYGDDDPAHLRAPALMSTSWPLIARQPARDLLGIDPVVIPGFSVRAYRRNPATQEIAVEQVTDAGTTISLIERRVDGTAEQRPWDSSPANVPRVMAKTVNERLARFVGPVRVEIEGLLTPDSLSSLLELAR